MKKTNFSFLLIVALLLHGKFAVGQQLMNLPDNSNRFTITDITWPANVGDAEVCLWHDDKVAAISITIDDNKEADHAWWLSMAAQYPIFTFTWFLNAGNSQAVWPTWQALINAGHDVQVHDNIATGSGHCDINSASDQVYHDAYEALNNSMNANLTDTQVATMAYPCGVARKDAIDDLYIACRGVYGTMNTANGIEYLETNSRSGFNDLLDVDRLLDPNVLLYNVSYYRGWSVQHYHGIAEANKAAATQAYLAAIYAERDKLWAGSFADVARYGQERDSHTLTVTNVSSNQITFTLTDQMHDTYFDFPLTVKVRINNSWTGVSAIQNGSSVEATMVTHNGNKYALVKAVPDKGTVTVNAGGTSTVNVTGVSVSPTSVSLGTGQTSNLTETVSPSNATNKSVTWNSNNTSVVTVNSSGVVTAVSSGNATITVTTVDGGYTANCAVTVTSSTVPVTGVSVSPTSLSLSTGQTSDLTETVSPSNATNKSVTWSSNNTSVATVNSNGLVTAVSAGSATVTVTTDDGSYTANCSVSVSGSQSGRTENITGSTDDLEIRSNGGAQWVGYASHRVGGAGSSYDGCSVHPFQLPVLSAGETVISADFSVYLNSISNNPGCNVDLYGLPYRSSSSVDAVGDYWQGSYGADGNSTAVQDNFATTSTSGSSYVTTSASGAQNLATYINAQYAAGAQAGDYIFIRINPDISDVGNYSYWTFASANDGANKPTLELEIGGGAPSVIPVTGVSISSGSLSLTEGQTSDLDETVSPSDATNKSVTWSSNNSSVATVNSSGLVTAVSAGSTTITVTTVDGGYTANCLVTVTSSTISVTGVSVAPTSLSLVEGQTSDLTETVSPSNATNKSVTWSSNNSSVATVNSSGLVTAVSAGSATITVNTVDGGYTANCNLTVTAISTTTNLALNKPITVSAYQDDSYGYKPGENLVDGDVSDDARWSASGFPQWAEIDLGTNSNLTQIKLYPYQNRAYQYIVEAKPDGGSYSTIVNRSSNTTGGDVLTDNVSASARYVKITVSGLSGSSSSWVSLSELEVYGTTSGGGGDIQAPSVPTSLSSSNIVQTSFTLSWNASTDNVSVTSYEVFKDGASIGTTSGTSMSVNGLTASTTYSMSVRAGDAAGNWSAQSSALNVTTSAGSGGGDWPTLATTGPSGTLTNYTGNITANTNGQIIENMNIDGRIYIKANNVTIRNCIFTALDIATADSYTGCIVEDCQLDWAGRENFTLRRCYMTGQSVDLVRVGGPNVTVEDSYLHIYGPIIDNHHSDCIQEYPVGTGTNLVVRHNRLYNEITSTSCIIDPTDMLCEDNLMAGGSYVVYSNSGQTLINNHISTIFFPNGGYYGMINGTPGSCSGNVIHETGAPINCGSSGEIYFAEAIQKKVNIYPNPLSGEVLNINLTGYEADVVNIKIIDLTGRMVYNSVHTTQSELELPVNVLSKGIYVVSVTGGGLNNQQKLVVE